MSFTRGLSIHHETNSVSQPTINNNISISASNEVKTNASSERLEVRVEQPVEQIEQSSIPNENAFLKKVLNIYMTQRFYFSGKFIVLTPDELLDLIQTLLPNKSVVIRTNDIEDVGCCSFKDAPIKKVDSVWVNDDESEQNFKYCFSNLVSLLEQYKISIKFVRIA